MMAAKSCIRPKPGFDQYLLDLSALAGVAGWQGSFGEIYGFSSGTTGFEPEFFDLR
ncbi:MULTISPECIES: hypothetical protein [Agrobacterium]|uniref:Uncharacterized protein n=2 Tax=Agrobacterium TaxID=357 RepID=A0AAF0GVE1_AGRTU|nr:MULTISPECIES: hypothetical protein [Agrobacterium]CVI61763.1 hypothetical protein AGR9A_Cc80058 [Agrobacterium salinitolerans str. Hayward 0363]MCZ7888792.1 hypothetical protein [Agrobacterium salinitolerans]MDA5627722.1 hypothetical protein [Agrobacterium sp. ST15.16.055]MDA5639994.1 hypothetical protein [Agrobacterium sp. ST15.13.013]MDA6978529.1 hypothetical protein [Agrobacterium salinitolerans]